MGEWCAFAANSDAQPGPVSTESLVGEDGRPRGDLVAGRDWRALTKWHFLFFVKTYGLSGPVVEFKAPTPVAPEDGSRLDVSEAKSAPTPPPPEEEEEEEKGPERGEEAKKAPGASSKGLSQPPWLSLVLLPPVRIFPVAPVRSFPAAPGGLAG